MPPEAQHWDLIKAKLRPIPGEVGVEYRTGSVYRRELAEGSEAEIEVQVWRKKAKGKGVGRSCHMSLQAITSECGSALEVFSLVQK